MSRLINKLLEKYGMINRSDYGVGPDEIEWLEKLSRDFHIPYEQLEEDFMNEFSLLNDDVEIDTFINEIIGSVVKGAVVGAKKGAGAAKIAGSGVKDTVKRSVKGAVKGAKAGAKKGAPAAKTAVAGIAGGAAAVVAGVAVSKGTAAAYKTVTQAGQKAQSNCKGDADCITKAKQSMNNKKIAVLQKAKGETKSPAAKAKLDKQIQSLKN